MPLDQAPWRTRLIAVGKLTADDESLFAIRDEHDVALLEQNKPTLVEAEGSTYELLARGAALAPQSPAVSFFLTAADYKRPWSWTYGEWLGRITQTANMFRKLGVERQDVIAFVMPNLPETHWVIWGGEAAGIVFAINPLLEAPLILDLLLAAKAKWLVTIGPTPGTDIWQKVSAVAPRVPSLQGILTANPSRYLRGGAGILFGALSRARTPRRLAHLKVLDLVAECNKHAAGALTFDPPAADSIASYFCTGGTTGLPKIAVRSSSHRTRQRPPAHGCIRYGPVDRKGGILWTATFPCQCANWHRAYGLGAGWTCHSRHAAGLPSSGIDSEVLGYCCPL